MIRKFNEYILESKTSIDYLETLNSDKLGTLLISEMRKRSSNIEYIQNLLDVGCPVEYRDAAGWTALHQAAHDGKIEIMELLISKGAGVNALDNRGETALHRAAAAGKLPAIQVLLSNGANIDIEADFGYRAWDFATPKVMKSFPELEPK